MMNTIRADIYRIVRGKALYITIVLLFGIIILQTIGDGVVIGIGSSDFYGESSIAWESANNGDMAVRKLSQTTDNLIYFMLPLFAVICSALFEHTVKNELSAGLSRVKLYLSKLLLSWLLCILLTLFYILSAFLIGTIQQGTGNLTGGFFKMLLSVYGSQLLLLLAYTSVGVFLSFATRRMAAVNGAYIAIALLPPLLGLILHELFQISSDVFKLDPVTNMKLFSYVDILPSEDIMRGFAIGMFMIIASTVAGIALFKRAEIK